MQTSDVKVEKWPVRVQTSPVNVKKWSVKVKTSDINVEKWGVNVQTRDVNVKIWADIQVFCQKSASDGYLVSEMFYNSGRFDSIWRIAWLCNELTELFNSEWLRMNMLVNGRLEVKWIAIILYL